MHIHCILNGIIFGSLLNYLFGNIYQFVNRLYKILFTCEILRGLKFIKNTNK